MILVYHTTKVGYIFIGTIQLDRSKTQPPLALMFNGSEQYLNGIVSAIRTQQAMNLMVVTMALKYPRSTQQAMSAMNLMGGAPAPTMVMMVQPVAAADGTLPV